MPPEISEFKLLERGFSKTMVLIPGWATDYRIFSSLDLPFNYLMPVKFSSFDFSKGLKNALEKAGLTKISLLGWSMGAFLAVDFISQYPDKVDEVILVSVRKKYEKKNIERIKSYLKKSKNGYLYKFFKSCFCQKEQETLSWFKKNFLSGYLNQMSLPLLLEGLDYLLSAQIDPQKLNRLKIKFVHGSKDKIAPLREALQIKDNLSQAEFISLKNTGHLPFLNPNFKILCAIK